LVFTVFVFSRLNLPDPDTWWHIAVGEDILASGVWPTTDSYSFTAQGQEWRAYEWLGEVLLAVVARGGPQALTALLIGLCATLFSLLYYWVTLRGCNPKAGFLACFLLVPLAGSVFTLRPQLLGYIFLLLTFVCLEHFRQGRRKALWALPALFAIWGNTHGNFAFGLFVLGVCWLGGLVEFSRGSLKAERWTPAQRRDLFVVILLCVLATMLGPYGARTTFLPLEIAFAQPLNVASIQEWQPLPFDLLFGRLFLVILLGFCVLQLLSPRAYRVEEVGLLLFAIYSACTHRRFLVFFVLVFAPLLAVQLERWTKTSAAHDRPLLNAALMAAAIGAMVVFFPSGTQLEEVTARRFPVHAVQYLRTHDAPRTLLNWYGWGGYMIWSLRSERKVFIDGRADLYEYPGILRDYLAVEGLKPNPRSLLSQYRVEACLFPRDSPLATFLDSQPDWKLVYSDDLSVIYVLGERQTSVPPQ
ncbi:MAG: hypothetical protein ACRD4U_12685, partial [Candidatus Acidiferrales bacterium]